MTFDLKEEENKKQIIKKLNKKRGRIEKNNEKWLGIILCCVAIAAGPLQGHLESKGQQEEEEEEDEEWMR